MFTLIGRLLSGSSYIPCRSQQDRWGDVKVMILITIIHNLVSVKTKINTFLFLMWRLQWRSREGRGVLLPGTRHDDARPIQAKGSELDHLWQFIHQETDTVHKTDLDWDYEILARSLVHLQSSEIESVFSWLPEWPRLYRHQWSISTQLKQ